MGGLDIQLRKDFAISKLNKLLPVCSLINISPVSTPCRGCHPHHLSPYKHLLLWVDHFPISQTAWLPYAIKLRAITVNPGEPFKSAAISGWMKGFLACFAAVWFLFCLSPTVSCPDKPFSVLPTQTSTVRFGEPLCSGCSGRKFWCTYQHIDRLTPLWCSRKDVI